MGAAAVQAAHVAPAAEPADDSVGSRGVEPDVDAVARVDADLHPAAIAPRRAAAVVHLKGGLREGDGVAGAVLHHGDLGLAVLAEHAADRCSLLLPGVACVIARYAEVVVGLDADMGVAILD